MSKPMRAVICYDIDLSGSLSDAASFEGILKEYAENFATFLKTKDQDIAKKVYIEKTQAEVPLQERRGSTGPLTDIVFRGSRIKPVDSPTIRKMASNTGYQVLSSTPIEVYLKKYTGDDEGKEYTFPIEQLPFSVRKYFKNPGSMDGKVIRVSPSRIKEFGIPK